MLYQLVSHDNFLLGTANPEFTSRLSSADEYHRLLIESGERRILLDDMLKRDSSVEGIMLAIESMLSLPHPVDRRETEKIYVVDAYIDNEFVLGQHISGNAHELIGVNEELTTQYHVLINSPRSFERLRLK